jgi:putative metallohydrolase (TIGR04338 family)
VNKSAASALHMVLHELAHHLTPDGAPHGPEYVATMTELAGVVMGSEAQHVLRVIYAKEGVRG